MTQYSFDTRQGTRTGSDLVDRDHMINYPGKQMVPRADNMLLFYRLILILFIFLYFIYKI